MVTELAFDQRPLRDRVPEEKFTLHEGERLVLYTDGVERPGEPADDATLRLVRQYGAEPSTVLTQRFAGAMRSGSDGNADDLAVVVLTVDAPEPSRPGRVRDIVHRMGVGPVWRAETGQMG
jgi:hypothetical protein